jgi:hypothetical protein
MRCSLRLKETAPWSHVSVVGDFNGWSTTATPMHWLDGQWRTTTDFPCEPRYAFFALGYDENGFPWSEVISADNGQCVPHEQSAELAAS